MGGFGALGMMNQSLKDNRALLGKKRSLKELYRELDEFKKTNRVMHEKSSSKELIIALRKKMMREHRVRLLKLIILLFVIVTIVSLRAVFNSIILF